MRRYRTLGVCLAGFLCLSAQAQDIENGKIKAVDADKGKLTVTTGDGKDNELTVTANTRIMGPDGGKIETGLKDKAFQPGMAVMFKRQVAGQSEVVGVRLGGPNRKSPMPNLPKVDLSKLKPLTEMGKEKYQDYPGGLYPDGNERPANHEKAGLALAKQVEPRDQAGKPDPMGKMVLLTVGMSNTSQVSAPFLQLANADPRKNPNLILVNGAQGGMTAARICRVDQESGDRYWKEVDRRLKEAGVTRSQVQVVWIKQADAGPSQGFPGYAKTLQDELGQIANLLHDRFPNVKLTYLSSRTFGGYAKTPLNPEPYAFESGLSVKWLIEQQLKGDARLNFDAGKGAVKSPWLSWGPYLWANGTTKRADGFFSQESDFGGDGTHHSSEGARKMGEQILAFFKNDSTTKGWFLK